MNVKHHFTMLSLVVCSLAQAVEVSSIVARGQRIAIGDSSDSVIAILKKSDMVSQDVEQTPTGMKVTKHFKVDGKKFVLVLARATQVGPYTVSKIDDISALPVAAGIVKGAALASARAFEATEFYRKSAPKKDNWTFKTGGMNYDYEFSDPENSYSSTGVTITESTSGPSSVSVAWYGTSTLSPARLTETKETFLRNVLRNAAPGVKPDDIVAYIRKVGTKRFSGGSRAMPRTLIAGMRVYSGTVGESLMIGLER